MQYSKQMLEIFPPTHYITLTGTHAHSSLNALMQHYISSEVNTGRVQKQLSFEGSVATNDTSVSFKRIRIFFFSSIEWYFVFGTITRATSSADPPLNSANFG
jgi:hypothetical protein